MSNDPGTGLGQCPASPEQKKPKLKLVGEDGNAFSILGRAQRVARQNKMDWKAIHKEATSGDYDHLLATMCKYFDVDGGEDDEEDSPSIDDDEDRPDFGP